MSFPPSHGLGERHGVLVMYLKNQYILGVDMYPKNITAAYNLAIKYKGGAATTKSGGGGGCGGDRDKNDKGILLPTNVTVKRNLSKIKCYQCQEMGHYYVQDCKVKIDDKPMESVNATTTAPASNVSKMTGVTGAAKHSAAPQAS